MDKHQKFLKNPFFLKSTINQFIFLSFIHSHWKLQFPVFLTYVYILKICTHTHAMIFVTLKQSWYKIIFKTAFSEIQTCDHWLMLLIKTETNTHTEMSTCHRTKLNKNITMTFIFMLLKLLLLLLQRGFYFN